MEQNTLQSMEDLIALFIKSNPDLHVKSQDQYIQELKYAFKDVTDKMVLEAIKICYDKKLYETKNIMYFKGIVNNLVKEQDKRKQFEQEHLAPISKIKW